MTDFDIKSESAQLADLLLDCVGDAPDILRHTRSEHAKKIEPALTRAYEAGAKDMRERAFAAIGRRDIRDLPLQDAAQEEAN
jgi:hypothetical protein